MCAAVIRGPANPKAEAIGHTCRASAATSAGSTTVVCSLAFIAQVLACTVDWLDSQGFHYKD